MDGLFHILYVDSDPLMAGVILRHFNPPQNMPIDLIKKLNKTLQKEERYDFLLTYTRNYKEALRCLLDHNFDSLQQKRGLIPFDTILFEVKERSETEGTNWLDFIADVAQLGHHRLGLNSGFLAFGAPINESIKEILVFYGVRKYLEKPFTFKELDQQLRGYLKVLRGSKYLYVEERTQVQEGGKAPILRRVCRYINRNGKATGIHLASLEKNSERGVLLLRDCTDGVILGELLEKID